jgi:hypothetical protein
MEKRLVDSTSGGMSINGTIGRIRLNGKEGVFKNSSVSWKNAIPDGTVIGYFSQSHPEF